jgi:hypothetical protein
MTPFERRRSLLANTRNGAWDPDASRFDNEANAQLTGDRHSPDCPVPSQWRSYTGIPTKGGSFLRLVSRRAVIATKPRMSGPWVLRHLHEGLQSRASVHAQKRRFDNRAARWGDLSLVDATQIVDVFARRDIRRLRKEIETEAITIGGRPRAHRPGCFSRPAARCIEADRVKRWTSGAPQTGRTWLLRAGAFHLDGPESRQGS